jgi:hypothetical protein
MDAECHEPNERHASSAHLSFHCFHKPGTYK